MLFVKKVSYSPYQSQASKPIAPIWLITNATVIPALVPALETVDGVGESTSVDEVASAVEVLSTEVLLFADGVASEAEVLSLDVTSSVEEAASEVEVLSAEVASSVEEVASEVEVTSSIEEVGFKVAVL